MMETGLETRSSTGDYLFSPLLDSEAIRSIPSLLRPAGALRWGVSSALLSRACCRHSHPYLVRDESTHASSRPAPRCRRSAAWACCRHSHPYLVSETHHQRPSFAAPAHVLAHPAKTCELRRSCAPRPAKTLVSDVRLGTSEAAHERSPIDRQQRHRPATGQPAAALSARRRLRAL